MDLKALMQKLETIDKKQNLMEAEKKETTWTDKSGKKHPATQVKGDKYTGKEAEKEDKKKADEGIVFNSAIANALLREFGLEEAGAEWAPTPEQEKWLGGSNRQDPYIMNRMPGTKPPVTYFKDPADQALAKQMKFPDAAGGAAASPAKPAAPTGTQAQGDDDGNTMITKPDGTTMVVGPDGNAIKPGSNPNLPQNKPSPTASAAMTAADQDDADMGAAMRANAQAATQAANGVNAQGQNVTMPGGINPETGEKTTTTAGAQAGGAAASPAAPAKPAAPAANKSMTPAITAYAASMGLLKNGKPDVAAIKKFQQDNGLQADGIIGPNTAGAILSAQKPGMAGSGRGGQGGPTAAQLATAKPAGGAAASPAAPANPEAAKIQAEIDRFTKSNNMAYQANKDYVAKLQAKLKGGAAASPAKPAGGATMPAVNAMGDATGMPAAESVGYGEDSILLRIRSLAGL